MKLGVFTAAFPTLPLEEIAAWASRTGFEMLEIACWPTGGADRRYAGVTHIDVGELTKTKATAIREMLDKRGLGISSLGFYPNPLHPETEVRKAAFDHLKKVIKGAELLGVDVVGTFIGRDKNRTVEQNLELYAKLWPPLVKYAADHGVKIAIENCPMIFSCDEWPGGTNLATSPRIWRQMWEIIPDANFGLNLDPSHLIWLMIDYLRVVREFKDRIFHVHAKDVHVDREGLYQNGVMSLGMGWQIPRLPGLGDVDWRQLLAALYAAGYDKTVSIEHEDRAFEGSVEVVRRGFLISRDVLRPLIH